MGIQGVVNPGSSTDNAVGRFDGTTGKRLQNSTVTIDDDGNIFVAYASLAERSSDPGTPPSGTSVLWISDGTGTGSAGDLMQIDDAGGITNLTMGAGGGGSGDVVGPASATDNAISRFNGTTGKLVQDSNATLGDNGGLALTAALATEVLGTFTAHASQSANLIECKSSGGTVGARVTKDREFSNASGGSTSEAFGQLALCAASSVAMGYDADSTGSFSVAVGKESVATGLAGVAVGWRATASAANAVALGPNSTCSAAGVAIGRDTTATTGVSIGFSADSGTNSFALGSQAQATGAGQIAIGTAAAAVSDNQLVIGGSSVPVYTAFLGKGVTNSVPTDISINATGGSGTDIGGADLTLAGGKGTGSGASGSLVFETSTAGSTGTTLQSLAERARVDGATGRFGINEASPDDRLHVTVGSSDGTQCLKLEQLDVSEGFVDFVSTSAANTTNPLTTYKTGNSIQGFLRVQINGTDRWIPFYDAPTS